MHQTFMLATPVLAEAYILMSIAKPILLALIFIPYMRFVAQFEPDARRFVLPVLPLNFLFIGVGVLALATVIFIPIFWIGLPVAAAMPLVMPNQPTAATASAGCVAAA